MTDLDVLIVDDEPLARERLDRMIGELDGYRTVAQADTAALALQAVAQYDPDIILLDIKMPGASGLEAAGQMGAASDPPAIIFCTAYNEHALDAFATPALAYLLKPVRREALQQALEKATCVNKSQRRALGEPEEAASLTAKTHRGLERIALADVRFFLADHKYVTVYHTGGEHLLDATLKELQEQLGDRFVRVHRNALVAMEHIRALERAPDGGYRVRLADVDTCPSVSRRHATQIKALLQRL